MSLNVYNSASRLAPLAVAGGAAAAIGFQDVFDDDLAELFFARFYSKLGSVSDPHNALLLAFLEAQEMLRDRANFRLVGSGIAFWRDRPLTEADLEHIGSAPTVGVAATPEPELAATP